MNVGVYFLYFIIYSFLGWVMEVIVSLVYKKKFVNRGFLIGPICPIYGFGILLLLFLIRDLNKPFYLNFIIVCITCAILEYLTSFFMEKIFKARWWDYSNKRFNLNGRICLEVLLQFGVLGTIVLYFVHPFIKTLISYLNVSTIVIISIILFIIYIIDNIVTFNVLNKIKNKIKYEDRDNTEEINQRIKKWIENNSILYKRLKNSFPNLRIDINKKIG